MAAKSVDRMTVTYSVVELQRVVKEAIEGEYAIIQLIDPDWKMPEWLALLLSTIDTE